MMNNFDRVSLEAADNNKRRSDSVIFQFIPSQYSVSMMNKSIACIT